MAYDFNWCRKEGGYYKRKQERKKKEDGVCEKHFWIIIDQKAISDTQDLLLSFSSFTVSTFTISSINKDKVKFPIWWREWWNSGDETISLTTISSLLSLREYYFISFTKMSEHLRWMVQKSKLEFMLNV